MGCLLLHKGKLFPKTAPGMFTCYFPIAIISQSPAAIEPTTCSPLEIRKLRFSIRQA